MHRMTIAAPQRMTAEEFLATAADRDGRSELVAGEVIAMALERAAHARVKARVWLALRDAIADSSLPCEAFTDGMAVRVDDATVYEPDALVRCGDRLRGDAVVVSDPVVVVEVLSPSTRARDAGAKLEDYFRLPSVVHYLLVKTDTRAVIHHRREGSGEIRTRILTGQVLALDPPGLEPQTAALFEELRPWLPRGGFTTNPATP